MNYKAGDTVLGAIETQTVGDFWQWAFGDLCDDDIKGIYAEWLVTNILEIPTNRRVSWANSDIITPDGIRLEVKASAFWQSWKLVNEDGTIKDLKGEELIPKNVSTIRFTGLIGRDSVSDQWKGDSGYKSEIYVFCFQNEKNPLIWNALDMNQWEFYIFDVKELMKFSGKSVSLKKLREHQAPHTAHSLKIAGQELINSMKNS